MSSGLKPNLKRKGNARKDENSGSRIGWKVGILIIQKQFRLSHTFSY